MYRVTSYSAYRKAFEFKWDDAVAAAQTFAAEGNLPSTITAGDNRWTVQAGCEPQLQEGSVNVFVRVSPTHVRQVGIMALNDAIRCRLEADGEIILSTCADGRRIA
jgi:hypothetical protein